MLLILLLLVGLMLEPTHIAAQTDDAAHAAIGDEFVALIPSRLPPEETGRWDEARVLRIFPLASDGPFQVASELALDVAEPVNDVLIHARNVIVQFSNTYLVFFVGADLRPREIARFQLEDPAPFFDERENLPVMWLEPLYSPITLVIYGKQVSKHIDLAAPRNWVPQPTDAAPPFDGLALRQHARFQRREQTWREPHVFTLTRAESEDEGNFYADYILARRNPQTGAVSELRLLGSFHFRHY